MIRFRTALKTVLARIGLLGPLRRLLGREPEHGHALLITLMTQAPTLGPGYLIEIGTTREKVEGQGSTVALARSADRLGLSFVTVDMDPANTEQARVDLAGLEGAQAVTAKGEEFLAGFGEPVVAAYLDAFDIAHGRHSQYRIDRYRQFLDAEITNDAAAAMHQACAEALATRVVDGGLIVIDDTWRVGKGFGGKGATAVPFLLAHGFRVAALTRTAIGLQRLSSPAG